MSRLEDSFQITAVEFLTLHGIFCAHVKNQGKWSPHYGAILNRMGRRAGMLDLLCITEISRVLPRGLFMVECKKPPAILKSGAVSQAKPRLEPDQEAMIATLGALGIPTLVVRSIEELERALRNMGVPLKGRAM